MHDEDTDMSRGTTPRVNPVELPPAAVPSNTFQEQTEQELQRLHEGLLETHRFIRESMEAQRQLTDALNSTATAPSITPAAMEQMAREAAQHAAAEAAQRAAIDASQHAQASQSDILQTAVQQAAFRAAQEATAMVEQRMRAQQSESRQPVREPKVASPDTFSGERKKAKSWLIQLQLVFCSQPLRYKDDVSKIMYAASYLSAGAFDWFSPFLQGNAREAQDWPAFQEAFLRTYGDHESETREQHKLFNLKQGKRTVAAYGAELQRLSFGKPFEQDTLRVLLYQGLNEDVKDALVTLERATTFQQLLDQAIRVDNRLAERRAQKAQPRQDHYNHHTHHRPRRDHHRSRHHQSTRLSSSYSGPTPMDVDALAPAKSRFTQKNTRNQGSNRDGQSQRAPRLSEEEHQRHIDKKLCFSCHKPGHNSRFCPNRSTNKQTVAATMPSSDNTDYRDRSYVCYTAIANITPVVTSQTEQENAPQAEMTHDATHESAQNHAQSDATRDTMQENAFKDTTNVAYVEPQSGKTMEIPAHLNITFFADNLEEAPIIDDHAEQDMDDLLTDRAEHLLVPINLSHGRFSCNLSALVDSGSHSSFCHQDLVTLLELETVPLERPIAIASVDGVPMAGNTVTHRTKPVLLTVDNHATEFASFNVLPKSMHAIILGVPWLRRHSPLRFSWTDAEITPMRTFEPLQVAATADHGLTMAIDDEDDDEEVDYSQLPLKYADFKHVFSKKRADTLPIHRKWDMEIVLQEGAQPKFGPIYTLSRHEQETLKTYIQENLAKGFIVPSRSDFASPVLFVKKRDGSLRLCVDYRALNAVTVKNKYPLPLLNAVLEQMRDSKWFSRLDLRSGYHLIRVKPESEKYTAFRTPMGLYQYKVLPFGLSQGPGLFQAFMNDTFKDMIDIFVVIYLDDLLIFSPDSITHDRHVRAVLQRLSDNQLYAKLEKCAFDQTEIAFLGHIVNGKGIHMDPEKIKAIVEWEAPKSVKDVRSLCGMANYYRRFIPDFSKLMLPLTDLLATKGKDPRAPFVWPENAELAFKTLKEKFTTAPILTHADPNRPFTLECDASDYAIGAVLSQQNPDDGQLRACGYFSRKLAPAEINYEVHDKELLAVVESLEHWRALLIGAEVPTTIYSDHRNLIHFTTSRRLNRRQCRWALFMADFPFKIVYRPGHLQVQSDALSRQPGHRLLKGDDAYDAVQNKALLPPDTFQLAVCALTDEDARPATLFGRIKAAYATDPLAIDILKNPGQPGYEEYAIKNNGVIYKDNKIYAPEATRVHILEQRHDALMAGHFGVARTLELCSRSFWWPKMKDYIKDYIQTCQVCSRAKVTKQAPAGKLMPLPVPSKPWTSVSSDFVVDLPPSSTDDAPSVKYDSILVFVDRLTKMVHFVPTTKTCNAAEMARLFIANVVRLHGVPGDMVSDRGPQYVSSFWRALQKALGVQINLSSTAHPQSDGETERANQTMEQYLRCYINYSQDNWANLLPLAEFAYNNSRHASTKITPFFANTGQHPNIDIDTTTIDEHPAALEKASEMQELLGVLRENMAKAQDAYKKAADTRRSADPAYQVGDLVWLHARNIRTTRPSKKLDYRKLGPFKIVAIVNRVAFRLELPPTMKIHDVFHASLLEPVHENHLSARHQAPPAPVIIDDEEEYVVDKILAHRVINSAMHYRVRWLGYGPEMDTWETAKSFFSADGAVNAAYDEYQAMFYHEIQEATDAAHATRKARRDARP